MKIFNGLLPTLVVARIIVPSPPGGVAPDIVSYTDNLIRNKDYRHDFYYNGVIDTVFHKNLSGWVKKDPENNINLSYTKSIKGSVSATLTSTYSNEMTIDLIIAAINKTNSLQSSISYSFEYSESFSYEYSISPDAIGNYFSIGINYKTMEYTIRHYHQEFKWFGQGEYVYEGSSIIRIPTEAYLAKNYRFEIYGDTYEA